MSPFQKGTRDQKDNSLPSIHHFSDMWSFWRFRTFQPSELCWLRDLYHEKRASSYAHLYSFPGEWRYSGAERSTKLLCWRSASGSWKSFWTRAIESCIYRLSSPWLQVFREICWLNDFFFFFCEVSWRVFSSQSLFVFLGARCFLRWQCIINPYKSTWTYDLVWNGHIMEYSYSGSNDMNLPNMRNLDVFTLQRFSM